MDCQLFVEIQPCPGPIHRLVLDYLPRDPGCVLVVCGAVYHKIDWLSNPNTVEYSARRGFEIPTNGVVVLHKRSLRHFCERYGDLVTSVILDNASNMRQQFRGLARPTSLSKDGRAVLVGLRNCRRLYIMHTPHYNHNQQPYDKFSVGTIYAMVHEMYNKVRDYSFLVNSYLNDVWVTASHEPVQYTIDTPVTHFSTVELVVRRCAPYSMMHLELAEWYRQELECSESDHALVMAGLDPERCHLHPTVDVETQSILDNIDLANNFSRHQSCYMRCTSIAAELRRWAYRPSDFAVVPSSSQNFFNTSYSPHIVLHRAESVANTPLNNVEECVDETCPICYDRSIQRDNEMPSVALSCGHCFCLFCSIRLCANVMLADGHFFEAVASPDGVEAWRLGAVVCPMCRVPSSKYGSLIPLTNNHTGERNNEKTNNDKINNDKNDKTLGDRLEELKQDQSCHHVVVALDHVLPGIVEMMKDQTVAANISLFGINEFIKLQYHEQMAQQDVTLLHTLHNTQLLGTGVHHVLGWYQKIVVWEVSSTPFEDRVRLCSEN